MTSIIFYFYFQNLGPTIIQNMAQKVIADLSEDFLQCSICMNQYNKPLMLPCVHSFCCACLEEYERNLQHQPFSCPTCRRIVDLPESGVKDLPRNFFLVNLIEKLETVENLTNESPTVRCRFCNSDINILFCNDCKIHICETCKDTHFSLPGMSGHVITAVDGLSDVNSLQCSSARVPQCNEHPTEKLRFYCTNCCQLVCGDC